jgi:hypothetical protein
MRRKKEIIDDIIFLLPLITAFALMIFALAAMIYHARPVP